MNRTFGKRFFNIYSLVFLAMLPGCGLLKNLTDSNNPCDCDFNQNSVEETLSLGQNGSEIVEVAQRFNLNSPVTISKVSVNLGRAGSYNAPLRLSIYPNDGILNEPNISGGAIATSVGTALSNDAASWVSFCFSADCTSTQVTLNSGTLYWATVMRPNQYASVSGITYFALSINRSNGLTGTFKLKHTGSGSVWGTADLLSADYSQTSLGIRFSCASTEATCN